MRASSGRAASPWLHDCAFADKVTLITGAAGGIGREIARDILSAGGRVALCDLEAAAAELVLRELDPSAGAALAIACDVSVPASAQAAVDEAVRWGGRLDLVVNAAGVMDAGRLSTPDVSSWRRIFAINVDGALNVAAAAYPHLRRAKDAALVNIASLSGTGAYPGGGAYGPSKAALISLSHQLAVEWGEDGVRVNVVSPGPTSTELFKKHQSPEAIARRAARAPLRRIAAPENIASVVLFLLSAGAISVTGQEIKVDCGLSQTLMDGPASWSERAARSSSGDES